jgi:protein farnesyltransferase subunit beta
MIDDGIDSVTSRDQRDLEAKAAEIYGILSDVEDSLRLNRDAHIKYLYGGIGPLSPGFISLDASRTWICYWITHSLALLGAPLPPTISQQAIIAFLASCQHPDGGFGGGPYQLPHLAPTYAAICTLVTLGGTEALSIIDRQRLHAYLLRMCVPLGQGGGMTMHEGGIGDMGFTHAPFLL